MWWQGNHQRAYRRGKVVTLSPNSVPQPAEGGELDALIDDILSVGRYDQQYDDAQMVAAIKVKAKAKVAALIEAARNQGHTAQFAKDQAEMWPEAYREGVENGIKRATGSYSYSMPMKSVRTRNTAFKLYAVKFFNGKIKERREALLLQLKNEQPAPVPKSDKE